MKQTLKIRQIELELLLLQSFLLVLLLVLLWEFVIVYVILQRLN